ncbi:MAG: DUF5063 domain-containing protein [Bacteroidales bacterium]|nr:DUF5063 domain-containing protein [Bacteroidales bacterium]
MSDHPVFSKTIIEMLTVANEFCRFMEKIDTFNKKDILEYLQKICPLLYIKGSLLPQIEVNEESTPERYITEEQWENIFNATRKKFGDDDIYFYINNHYSNEDEPVKASLAENFADIYQDLQDFVLLYQKNSIEAKENAVSECKALFETHWGYRIINSQKAIHYLLYNDQNNEYEDIF